MLLISKNNSLTCNGKHHEGNLKIVSSVFGNQNTLTIKPKKHILLEEKGKCRLDLYTNVFNENFLQNIAQCPKPCKPPNYWQKCLGFDMRPEIGRLPQCHGNPECFEHQFTNTIANTTAEPCTKLQYQVEVNQEERKDKGQVVYFKLLIDPTVAVEEEYMIFDTVSMIGAIGGTMGLLMGFSCTGVVSAAISMLEKAIQHLLKKHSKPNQFFK